MACEYCYMPTKYHDGKHWEGKHGDQGCISHANDGSPLIAIWNRHEPARSLLLIRNIQYCPFCGDEITLIDRIAEIIKKKEEDK